ncbi:hypothetical protein ACP70R_032454 [Stipagrostis hirtigluma subsp. patula]
MTEGTGNKDTRSDSSEKTTTTGGRRSHHGERHNLTQKKRRYKIKERLKTLQQLVPGCDNQVQPRIDAGPNQVQAMSVGPARPAAAVHPAMQPQ